MKRPGIRDRSLFVDQVIDDMKVKTFNKTSLLILAKRFGIEDKNLVKELAELAIVKMARAIALNESLSVQERFSDIVDLYKRQANASHRTSRSILLQQYSTPAPISFLASLFVYSGNPQGEFFEPSAGNGLLTIAIPPQQVVVNEIDDDRRTNLEQQGYKALTAKDATLPFKDYAKRFDGVTTNPPFGRIDKTRVGKAPISVLDHLMALRALETIKDTGRAAIIVGGHTSYNPKGRITEGKNRIFYTYLYEYFNVVDSINIDGKSLYSRQGTGFDVRLILIDGKADKPSLPPYYSDLDNPITSFEDLYDRVAPHLNLNDSSEMNELQFEAEALHIELELLKRFRQDLGLPYMPGSGNEFSLKVDVPDSMAFDMHQAVARVKKAVGGSLDAYVKEKLEYSSEADLHKALSAEQVDAVAMALFNIEKGQAIIVGDQTGIGKGRVAAGVIRGAIKMGYCPMFITEKPNLFTDLYRDLVDIGSAEFKPFIVNGREDKTNILDKKGNVIYQAPEKAEQSRIFESFDTGNGELSDIYSQYDYIVTTYSQVASSKPTQKQSFISKFAKGNILIMDEAHNASGGESATGVFLQGVVERAKGITFLSATFAKTPANMPIYGMKTSMQDANMSKENLVDAIKGGGVALQEIVAGLLVEEGQMIRRERTYEGIKVNYLTLTERQKEHSAMADKVTEIIRDIIDFQKVYIKEEVKALDKIVIAEGKEAQLTTGTNEAGVDNEPYFSRVFQIISQLLMAIKAEDVADRAIMRLKEGMKPIIAFGSTFEAVINSMEDENGLPVSDGSIINTEFGHVLQKGLEGVMRISVRNGYGEAEHTKIEVTDLPEEGQQAYYAIVKKIKKASTGICISPIDLIKQKLEKAGYKVLEVTGRKIQVKLNSTYTTGQVLNRKKENVAKAFQKFNDNEVDVLMINQSGSTGASGHAIVTPKVSREQVKKRVMIVLQFQLDVNTEVQLRGRIHRTGQVEKPTYDYVTSAIPAEKRLMMMLQKKLKSLDANTSSNQKQSKDLLDTDDFLNRFGDQIVEDYLKEFPEVNEILDDPLKLNSDSKGRTIVSPALTVSGRVAVLPVKDQENFYNEVIRRYREKIEYLKQIDEYDLEVEALDLQAETIKTQIAIVGKNPVSVFGTNSMLETVKAKVLKKPFKKMQVVEEITSALEGKTAEEYVTYITETQAKTLQAIQESEVNSLESYYNDKIDKIHEEKRLKKAKTEEERNALIKQLVAGYEESKEEAVNKAVEKIRNNELYLKSFFEFFYPGRPINFPYSNFAEGNIYVKGICLGAKLDMNRKNPFIPSAVQFRFAFTNGLKYMSLPASGETGQKLHMIKGATYELALNERRVILDNWDDLTKEAAADFQTRHIITGNILQAFPKFPGKLVSYTTKDGGTNKGILLHESFVPADTMKDKIEVPIMTALPFVKSLTIGQSFSSKDGRLSISRQYDAYKIIVEGGKKGKSIYLDEGLMALTQESLFNIVSSKMAANVDLDNITRFLEILQEKHGISAELNQEQFEYVKDKLLTYKPKEVIDLPKAAPATSDNLLEMELELEAEALTLELELLQISFQKAA
jgi:predicted RNA methylase